MARQVEPCLSCGHGVGIGRFCVSCGHPEPDRTSGVSGVSGVPEASGVSEHRSRRVPVSPPPVYEAPPPARYPLFADETGDGSSTARQATAEPPAGLAETTVGPVTRPTSHQPRPDRRRSVGPWWIAAAVVAVMLLGAGGWRALGDPDPDPAASDGSDSGSDSGSVSPTTVPVEPAPDDARKEGGQVDLLDLTRLVSASPPGTAAPSRDVRGNAVRYEAFNMLDGQPDTAWRTVGDASGQEVVFGLDGPTRITQVGLLNGYAKVEPGYDGYAANRRITSVEWVFADGTVVPQTLGDNLTVQSIPLDGVVSDTVTLRILTVTDPAAGPTGRDYTAISDVRVVGSPT